MYKRRRQRQSEEDFWCKCGATTQLAKVHIECILGVGRNLKIWECRENIGLQNEAAQHADVLYMMKMQINAYQHSLSRVNGICCFTLRWTSTSNEHFYFYFHLLPFC